MSDDNGGKWFSSGNVIRTLFWIIFSGIVCWGTFVFTETKAANAKADAVQNENRVQDERINGIRRDLDEIKADQKEILRRIPR